MGSYMAAYTFQISRRFIYTCLHTHSIYSQGNDIHFGHINGTLTTVYVSENSTSPIPAQLGTNKSSEALAALPADAIRWYHLQSRKNFFGPLIVGASPLRENKTLSKIGFDWPWQTSLDWTNSINKNQMDRWFQTISLNPTTCSPRPALSNTDSRLRTTCWITAGQQKARNSQEMEPSTRCSIFLDTKTWDLLEA